MADKFFFVTYAMKKPKVQILLEAFKSCDMPQGTKVVDLVKPGCDLPTFWTSHQLFQDIAQKFPQVQNHGVPFVIHEYALNPFGTLCNVRTTRAIEGKLISCEKRQLEPKQTRLPFGLKLPPRKRKPRQKKDASQKRQRQNDGTASSSQAKSFIKTVQEKGMQALFSGDADGCPSVPFDQGNPKSDSCPSSSCSSSDSDIGYDKVSDSEIEDAEKPFLTSEAAHEDLQIQALLQRREDHVHGQHDSGVSGSGSASSSSSAPPSSSGAPKPSEIPSVGVPTGKKTFCNASLGLVEVGVQVSGKLATCRHCLIKIPKGEVRFGFAWSRVKFHSWLHASCALPHLKQESSNLEEAIEFLQAELKKDKGSKASCLIDATKKLLQELSQESA